MTSSPRYVVALLVVAVVGAAVVAGLLVVGSPEAERRRRMDDRRVSDLVQITSAINEHWTRNRGLPASLDVLRDRPSGHVAIVDPVTAQQYGYRPFDGKSYELCADFQRELTSADSDLRGRFWAHGTGRKCFRLDAEETHR